MSILRDIRKYRHRRRKRMHRLRTKLQKARAIDKLPHIIVASPSWNARFRAVQSLRAGREMV